jgi:hypothetical protein
VPDTNHKYTVVAAKAVSLAELFIASFAKGLDGPVRFRVEMSAPDGPSTGGGKQALQHIKLVPDGGGPAIVVGSADTTRGVAEVRTFDHIAALYAQRFHGAPIPVDAGRYNELAQTLSNFFRGMSMEVSFAELAPEAMTARQSLRPAGEGSSARSWIIGIVAGVAALGLVAAAYVLIYMR